MSKRCILIWPPFLTGDKVPLGIPFLAAYVRKKGIKDIRAIDLNAEYLKGMRLFRGLAALKTRYWRLVEKFSSSSGPAVDKVHRSGTGRLPRPAGMRKRPSARMIVSVLHGAVSRSLNRALKGLEEKEKNSIPWSLNSIMRLEYADVRRKKMHSLLEPFLKEERPSIVGISAIYPRQLYFAFLIAKVIKEQFGKEVSIVIGGSQVTKHIEKLSMSEELGALVDFFVTDDGEEALFRLLSTEGTDYSDTPNLHYRSGNAVGVYKKSEKTFYLSPSEFSVPDFTGFALDSYRGQAPILVSKGCFWGRCSFCTYASMQKRRYDAVSVDKTLGLMEGIKNRYGMSRYRFVDDALPPGFMKRLAEGLLSSSFDGEWRCNIVLSREFADRGFCAFLRKSGLSQVAIGLESACPRVLKLMNKHHNDIDASGIKEIFSVLKEAGIRVVVHVIFGFPTETVREAKETLKFLVESRDLYDGCMVQPFSLEDGTPLFNNPGTFKITRINTEDKNSGQRLGYSYEVSQGMTQREAERFTYEEAIPALKRVGISV